MKKDEDIERDLKEEIKWDTKLLGAGVETKVKDGRAALSGKVESYAVKIAAEKAASRVAGVIAVSNQLEVKIPSALKKSDEEIEKAIFTAIKWNSAINESNIVVTVENGWVSLEGEVTWEYQRARARHLAENITGVTGVTNLINVTSSFASSHEVKENIDAAMRRNFYLNTNKINVEVNAGKVLLTGKVRTLAEKSAAENSAWCAPGITEVVNELVIESADVIA